MLMPSSVERTAFGLAREVTITLAFLIIFPAPPIIC